MNAVVLMATDCDDGEEVSRVRLRYPKHLMSGTIADRDTAGDCIGRAGLSGVWLRYPKHLGVHAGAGVCALTSSRRGPTGGVSTGIFLEMSSPHDDVYSSVCITKTEKSRKRGPKG